MFFETDLLFFQPQMKTLVGLVFGLYRFYDLGNELPEIQRYLAELHFKHCCFRLLSLSFSAACSMQCVDFLDLLIHTELPKCTATLQKSTLNIVGFVCCHVL